jgi:hypothetical protein
MSGPVWFSPYLGPLVTDNSAIFLLRGMRTPGVLAFHGHDSGPPFKVTERVIPIRDEEGRVTYTRRFLTARFKR